MRAGGTHSKLSLDAEQALPSPATAQDGGAEICPGDKERPGEATSYCFVT